MTLDARRPRRPRTPAVCAAVAALMVGGGFAMIAVVPVAITLISAFRGPGSRPLRWWALGLGGLYATGLLSWALRSDPAPSLTKDLHPVLAGLIVAAALAVALRYAALVRRDRSPR